MSSSKLSGWTERRKRDDGKREHENRSCRIVQEFGLEPEGTYSCWCVLIGGKKQGCLLEKWFWAIVCRVDYRGVLQGDLLEGVSAYHGKHVTHL